MFAWDSRPVAAKLPILALALLLSRPGLTQDGATVRPITTPQGQRKLWMPATQAKVEGVHPAALLVLHSSASSPAQIERLTGYTRWARQEGFLVAYPEGLDGRWNDGRTDAFPPSSGQDDVLFLNGCLDLLVKDLGADPKKLFVVGFDSGGSLALTAGLQLAGQLAGVAACMAGFSASLEPRLARPCVTPMLIVQSESDPCVPFQGGEVRYFGGKSRGQVLPSDRLMQLWSGLPAPTDQVALPGGRREMWGAKVVRIRLSGAGHLWPGTEAPVSEELFGPLQRDMPASQTIWDFFRGQP